MAVRSQTSIERVERGVSRLGFDVFLAKRCSAFPGLIIRVTVAEHHSGAVCPAMLLLRRLKNVGLGR